MTDCIFELTEGLRQWLLLCGRTRTSRRRTSSRTGTERPRSPEAPRGCAGHSQRGNPELRRRRKGIIGNRAVRPYCREDVAIRSLTFTHDAASAPLLNLGREERCVAESAPTIAPLPAPTSRAVRDDPPERNIVMTLHIPIQAPHVAARNAKEASMLSLTSGFRPLPCT